MDKDYGEDNEKYLFHVTNRANVAMINTQRFSKIREFTVRTFKGSFPKATPSQFFSSHVFFILFHKKL